MSSAIPHELRILVTGQVQGVFFRSKTKKHADHLGIKGSVRNLASGNVEICVFGTKEEADTLLAALKNEPPPIVITGISITENIPSRNYSDFRILY